MLPAASAPRGTSPIYAVLASVPVGDLGVHPPVEPIYNADDTERRCGCDATYTCRWHETSETLSDGELERALEDLETRDSLTSHARDVLVGIDALDLVSQRALDLYSALIDWDAAGLGEGTAGTRLSVREHELVYRRIGAALLDQVIADRKADPNLGAELAASVATVGGAL
jgi:hypothetical protein